LKVSDLWKVNDPDFEKVNAPNINALSFSDSYRSQKATLEGNLELNYGALEIYSI
jgi:hypothetical protein